MKLKMVRNQDRKFAECRYYWQGKIELDGREHDFLLTESQIKQALDRADRKPSLINQKKSRLFKILGWA
jgi:hypothetical protein